MNMEMRQGSLRLQGKRLFRAALLAGYLVVGLAANFCFKEGGTDTSHRLFWFIGGNVLGITSTSLLMGLYARMNVNLAMVLATSGSFLLMQGAFWIVYHTPLTALQLGGIAMVGAGTVLASLQSEGQREQPALAELQDAAPGTNPP